MTDTFCVLRLSEQSGKDFLRSLLATGRAIPFIGAGFSAGESAYGGSVPNGTDFMKTMKDAINQSAMIDKPSVASIENYSFQQLADEYFREPIVDIETIKTTLRNQFTQVSIKSEAKKDFLRWDWEYLYTLNIDDAIERELGAIKVLPFTDFAQHKTTQFVYKLHGDAADAVTAATSNAMQLIFGSADYVSSLIKNRALISTLINDLVERHLLFVGCSLTDEIDILFALAQISNANTATTSANRVYVTASEPTDYESKKKLRRYGITEVLVVDYPEFYAFVSSLDSPSAALKSPLTPYAYGGGNDIPQKDANAFLQYLLQIDWKAHQDPSRLAAIRDDLNRVKPLLDEPMIVVWGRRFSGRTTLLFAVLAQYANRKRYFIPSTAAASDAVLNSILRAKDCLIGIDSGAMSYGQLQLIVKKLDQLRSNNSSIVLATSRGWLSALGSSLAQASIEIKDRMTIPEGRQVNAKLEPFGISKSWRVQSRNLDNIFSLSESPVVGRLLKRQSKLLNNIGRLHQQWTGTPVGKLEFSVLFYLATRQRIYSRYFRELATNAGLAHLSSSHFSDFASQWEPFIELEDADPISGRSERSMQVLVANSNAWVNYSIRKLALKLGASETATQIVRAFEVLNNIEDKAFELLLFDNLNTIFSEESSDLRVPVIQEVYARLATLLARDPDYWLQRAKGIYYLSNDVDELRVGVEYCEKSVVQRANKTSINAKLTKANILGKICKLSRNPDDSDLTTAIEAYVEAIESRAENPIYIDELLRKSKSGKSYMSLVCRLANKKAALLPRRHEIEFIKSYIAGKF